MQQQSEHAANQHERDMAEMQLRAHTEKLKAEARITESNNQRAIIEKMIDASLHVFDRKMDFLVQQHTDMQSMIRGLQDDLKTQINTINDKIHLEDLKEGQRIYYQGQLPKLQEELSKLTLLANDLRRDLTLQSAKLNLSLDEAQARLKQLGGGTSL